MNLRHVPRSLLRIGVGFGFFAICSFVLYEARRAEGQPASRPASVPATRPVRSEGEPMRYRALSIQLYNYHHAREIYRGYLEEIAGIGANAVKLVAHAYQEHAGSNNIYMDFRAMPTPEQWAEVLGHCRRLGLATIMMPTVQLTGPRGNEWRGRIRPGDWDRWWSDYRDVVLYLADVAQANGVDVLIVGSELISTEADGDRWKRLIGEVRTRYRGRIAYSANWDHYDKLPFLDDLDYIGMTSYYSLTSAVRASAPAVDELVKAWEPIRAKILDFHARRGKPILFTEMGYCSQHGTTTNPWNYYLKDRSSPEGLAEQANAYAAFLQVFGDRPEVAGICVWDWYGPGGEEEAGYTPRGKPAEQVLRGWLESQREMGRSAGHGVADSQPGLDD